MFIAVVGGRDIHGIEAMDYVFSVLDDFVDVHMDTIVTGGARGIDGMAEAWAGLRKVPFIVYLPKDSRRGQDYLDRNTLIVENSTVVLAFPGKDSRGTYDVINKARKMKRLIVFDKFIR